MMLAIATAAGGQFPPLIGRKKRREQRNAEQRDEQQCERAPDIQTFKYDTERYKRELDDECSFGGFMRRPVVLRAGSVHLAGL
jgi:hypothetical protein